MPRESYESEPKERIDQCLNCTIPPERCFGRGDCMFHKTKSGRRRAGELTNEVFVLFTKGYKVNKIAKMLGVKESTVWNVITRLKNKNMLGGKQDR